MERKREREIERYVEKEREVDVEKERWIDRVHFSCLAMVHEKVYYS